MPLSNYSTSVVIPSFNGRHLLAKHLPAVLAACKDSEILVVDDASSDGTKEWLENTFPAIRIIALEKNMRFAGACNAGVSAASGEIVVLLNNDVTPERDFMTPLLPMFAENEKLFAVGCKEIQQNGIVRGRSGGTIARGIYQHWACKSQVTGKSLWASGGSAAFRKDMWAKLGGMDIQFAPAYEEDRELGYRAWKQGYETWFCAESVVHHVHETTNAVVFSGHEMERASFKNHLLLIWKHISDLQLLWQHLCWLPYWIVVQGVRTGGMTTMGFLWAMTYLPTIFRQRRAMRKLVTVSDEELVKYDWCT